MVDWGLVVKVMRVEREGCPWVPSNPFPFALSWKKSSLIFFKTKASAQWFCAIGLASAVSVIILWGQRCSRLWSVAVLLYSGDWVCSPARLPARPVRATWLPSAKPLRLNICFAGVEGEWGRKRALSLLDSGYIISGWGRPGSSPN